MTKHSQETKDKISLSSKGVPKSEKHKKALSEAHTGKILSQDHKDNIGEALTGLKRSAESIVKYSESKTGAKNPKAILTEEDVKIIKTLISQGATNQDLYDRFKGVADRTIRDIRNNKTWKHIVI